MDKTTVKEIKKVISQITVVFLLTAQVFPYPYAYSDSSTATQGPSGTLVPVISPTSTNTQTQTQSSTQKQNQSQSQTQTSTQWMSQGPLSITNAQPETTINGAYKVTNLGTVKVEDRSGNDYLITTENGTQLTPSDEVREVSFKACFGNCVTLSDYIDIRPEYYNCSYSSTGPICSPGSFVRIRFGQVATFKDNYNIGRNGAFHVPQETQPNFVEINGKFVPLSVTTVFTDPLGQHYQDVSFTVPTLKADGRDRIKFLSPYPYTSQTSDAKPKVLILEYAVSHDATKWFRFGRQLDPARTGGSSYITVIDSRGAKEIATGLSADTKVLDYYFNADGTQLIIKTANATYAFETATGARRTVEQTSPDGRYKVTRRDETVIVNNPYPTQIVQTYLKVTYPDGQSVERLVAGDQRTLQGFSVTNQGIYLEGEQRSNWYLEFITFDNFRATENVMGRYPYSFSPEMVNVLKAGVNTKIEFVSGMPGVADIRGNDLVTRRVDLNTGLILSSTNPRENDIINLYLTLLIRGADAGGLIGWRDSGLTIEQIKAGFEKSAEYRSIKVDQMYQVFLLRKPSTQEVNGWVNSGVDLPGIKAAFLTSDEYIRKISNNADFLRKLYFDALGRGADEGGFDYWMSILNRGIPRVEIVKGFIASSEYRARLAEGFLVPASKATAPALVTAEVAVREADSTALIPSGSPILASGTTPAGDKIEVADVKGNRTLRITASGGKVRSFHFGAGIEPTQVYITQGRFHLIVSAVEVGESLRAAAHIYDSATKILFRISVSSPDVLLSPSLIQGVGDSNGRLLVTKTNGQQFLIQPMIQQLSATSVQTNSKRKSHGASAVQTNSKKKSRR